MKHRPVAIPEALVDAFKEGRGAVFVGAGASTAAGLATWAELVEPLGRALGIEPKYRDEVSRRSVYSSDELIMIAQYYENRNGRKNLSTHVRRALAPEPIPSSPIHSLLAQLPTDLYYTTNLDLLMERALSAEGVHFDLIRSEATARNYPRSDRQRCQVTKIHGSVDDDANDWVLTRHDFATFIPRSPLIVETLRHDLRTRVFLFVGYSLKDPDFNSIFDQVLGTMGAMNNQHFAYIPDASEHARDDLRRRGVVVLPLATDEPADLGAFLKSLVSSTSDTVHLRSFFRDLSVRKPDVPIIVSSTLHAEEHYPSYAVGDIHAARAVESALARIGCRSSISSDIAALRSPQDLVESDLILICSPFGNRFTEHVLRRAEEEGKPLFTFTFLSNGKERSVRDCRGREYLANDPLNQVDASPRAEYAVVARCANPWAANRWIFLFAGLHAIGTHIIGDVLEDPTNFGHFQWDTPSAATLLSVTYLDHDPYLLNYAGPHFDVLPAQSSSGTK